MTYVDDTCKKRKAPPPRRATVLDTNTVQPGRLRRELRVGIEVRAVRERLGHLLLVSHVRLTGRGDLDVTVVVLAGDEAVSDLQTEVLDHVSVHLGVCGQVVVDLELVELGVVHDALAVDVEPVESADPSGHGDVLEDLGDVQLDVGITRSKADPGVGDVADQNRSAELEPERHASVAVLDGLAGRHVEEVEAVEQELVVVHDISILSLMSKNRFGFQHQIFV